MEIECITLSDSEDTLSEDVSIILTEKNRRSKRKRKSIYNTYTFYNVSLSKRKSKKFDNIHDQKKSGLSNLKDNKFESNVKIADLKLDAIMPQLKPCSVKLIPLYSSTSALPIAEVTTKTNNKKQNIKSKFKKFTRIQKKRQRNNFATGIQRKRQKNNLFKKCDMMKNLKPCSVILEKINLNYFSNEFKINIPVPQCSNNWVKLRPCSVKLHSVVKIKKEPVDDYESYAIKEPTIVKLEKIDVEKTSALNICEDEKCDGLDIAASEEKLELVKSLEGKTFDSSLPFKNEGLTLKSSSRETQLDRENLEVNFQNSLELSLKSSDNVSNSEVHDSYTIEFDYQFTDLNDSFNKKCVKYDSSDASPVKELQNNFQSSSPSYHLKNFVRRSSLEILKDCSFSSSQYEVSNLKLSEKTDLEHKKDSGVEYKTSSFKNLRRTSFHIIDSSPLSCIDIKCNEFSNLKATDEPYFKLNDNGIEHEVSISKKFIHCCHQCSKALPSLKSFYYHVCQGKQKRGYACKFCEKYFDLFRALRKHKKSHSLRNSFSCSDIVKSRRSSIADTNCMTNVLEKAPKFSGVINKNVVKDLDGKENSSSPKLKTKRLKTKFFLKNISDATTSSGNYSTGSNFSPYIPYPDDSEVE